MTKKIDELGETSYTYNALDMLLEVSKKQDGKKTVYAYDGAGNRTKETLTTNEGDKVIQYEYNQKNQLVKKIEADNSVTVYTYDHNGNEIQVQKNEEVITQNTYNAKNELIKTIENGIETTYQYDVLGNRIEKTSGGHTTKYFYEGNQVILELNEHNEQIAKNVYGINLIARSTPEQLGYYMYNGHGDVVQILDESSNLLNRYGYDEFGNIIAQEEQMDNPYQYAGYYYDKETKNYYLLNRYYNPEIARFISEDTYRGEINDPLSLNQYVYARSNPLRYNDPNGHFAIPVVTGFIGGVFSSGASIIGDLLAGNGIDWIKAGGAFVEGAIIGGSLGLAAPLGMPTLLGTAYLSGTLGNAVNQKIVTGEVDWWQANVNGLATAVGVGTFGINGDVTSKGVKWIQDYAIKGAVSSMASNTTSQLLTKNIRDFSFGEVALSGVVGAVMAPIGTKVTQVAIDKLGPSQYTLEKYGKEVTLDKRITDLKAIDEQKRNYTERKSKHLAVMGKDGEAINLHHIGQKDGPVMEMLATKHRENNKTLHVLTKPGYRSQIDRKQNASWNSLYWKWRWNNIDYIPEEFKDIGGTMMSIFTNKLNESVVPNK